MLAKRSSCSRDAAWVAELEELVDGQPSQQDEEVQVAVALPFLDKLGGSLDGRMSAMSLPWADTADTQKSMAVCVGWESIATEAEEATATTHQLTLEWHRKLQVAA